MSVVVFSGVRSVPLLVFVLAGCAPDAFLAPCPETDAPTMTFDGDLQDAPGPVQVASSSIDANVADLVLARVDDATVTFDLSWRLFDDAAFPPPGTAVTVMASSGSDGRDVTE